MISVRQRTDKTIKSNDGYWASRTVLQVMTVVIIAGAIEIILAVVTVFGSASSLGLMGRRRRRRRSVNSKSKGK
jgi:hypothetical protein